MTIETHTPIEYLRLSLGGVSHLPRESSIIVTILELYDWMESQKGKVNDYESMPYNLKEYVPIVTLARETAMSPETIRVHIKNNDLSQEYHLHHKPMTSKTIHYVKPKKILEHMVKYGKSTRVRKAAQRGLKHWGLYETQLKNQNV